MTSTKSKVSCWRNLNQIVWYEMKRKIELLDKKPSSFKTIFDKALTPFCEKFLWLKQLFHGKLLIFRLPFFSVSKIMTRLKVAPNMADSTSMKHSSLRISTVVVGLQIIALV